MHNAILFGLAILSIATIAGFAMIPASLSVSCPQTFSSVSSSEAPEYDKNQNGIICTYTRSGSPSTTVYVDDA